MSFIDIMKIVYPNILNFVHNARLETLAIKIINDVTWSYLELLLGGDIESNPGPVQSRPLRYCNNDPKYVKLEKAMERKDQKMATMLRKIKQMAKNERITAQLFGFGSFKDIPDIKNLNGNIDRVFEFLDANLPMMGERVESMTNMVGECNRIKEDMVKIIFLILIVRLFMVWRSYRAALAVILVVMLKWYGFDETIINLAIQIKEKLSHIGTEMDAEEIIYHPTFALCGKIIFAALAFICVKKIPGKQDWDSYMVRLDRIPKSINGGKQIWDWCTEYFNLANDQVKMMVLGKTREELRSANGLYEEIYKWAEEVRTYLDLAERNKIDTDITVANKVEKLYQTGLKYKADHLLNRDIMRLVDSALLPARSLFEYVSCSPIKGGGPRMRPISIWLIGESGIGKTEMIYPLCIDIMREMGLCGADDYKHNVYARQVETEYWDGYKGQKIVIYDDAFQMKDDKAQPNPEIFEVIRSCNTFPQHLHMAALHDKNTFSNAEVLLYTTNDKNVKIESLTYPEAFHNRMNDNAYVVRPKLEFRKVEDLPSGRKKISLDKTKLRPGVAIDLDIYEFQKVLYDANSQDNQWTDIGESISYKEFAEIICNQWRAVKTDSTKKLQFLENYAVRPIRTQMGDFQDCYNDRFFIDDIAIKLNEGKQLTDIIAEYAENEELYNAYYSFKYELKTSKWDTMKMRLDSIMVIVRDYLTKLQGEIIGIIKQHPYLSLLGLVGIAVSAFAMYQHMSTMFVDKVNVEIGNSGDVKTVKSRFVAIEVGNSGDVKTNKQQRQRVEVGSSGDVKTNRQRQQRVEVGNSGDDKTQRQRQVRVQGIDDELNQHIVSQGCSDSVAQTLVTDVLQKNTYRITYDDGDVRRAMGNCTFLKGYIMMMPYHFITALWARKVSPTAILYFSQAHFKDILQMPVSHIFNVVQDGFELTGNCVQMELKNGDKQDCVLINMHRQMCHPHRNILKHFILSDDQGKINGKVNGAFATFHHTNGEIFRTYQWLSAIKPVDQDINIYYPEDHYNYGSESYVQRQCYQYSAPTQVGDCGSIIGVYNHRVERKLIGMHIAGGENFGYSCPLTCERLEVAIKRMHISSQLYYEIPESVNSTIDPVIPDGNFCPLGKSDKTIGQATKSAIIKSSIHGKLTVPFMAPALLRPKFINGILHNPLLSGLKKCGVSPKLLDDNVISAASNDVAQIVLQQYNDNVDKLTYSRILNYEEAIMGANDDFMCSVNRTTSPGFPWNTMLNGKPGKTRWMGKGVDFDFISEDAQFLRTSVFKLIDDCAEGKITDVFCVDTLKDERREIEKVNCGKTRVFSACPQHFVVAFRMYFLPFSAWLMHNRIDNEICVGTNPYSLDWERITQKLKMKGNKVIAGDFSNFDGSLNAQILWSIFWDVFVPWLSSFMNLDDNDGKRTLQVCLGLWSHVVHSVHIFNDNVYMWTHSQPSGNPFTVIINSLYNSIVMRISWIIVMQKENVKLQSMKQFRRYVSMISYGDDNVLNIHDDVVDIFNQQTIADALATINHTYTDETKSGQMVQFRNLSDINFLKRGFRFSNELFRHVAPLKKDVIYEMLNWSRNTIDPNVILSTNIETAFREIIYHGKEEFLELKSKIASISNDLQIQPQILTYEEYLHDIKNSADAFLDF